MGGGMRLTEVEGGELSAERCLGDRGLHDVGPVERVLAVRPQHPGLAVHHVRGELRRDRPARFKLEASDLLDQA